MISKRLALLLWISFLHLAGIYLFTRGFLLTRLSLSNYTTCADQKCTLPPTYKRAVLLIIDALRFDFVSPHPPTPPSPYHHNILTLPRELTAARPGHSFLFNAYADPPTTTLQRIKGITTGSLPTFVDIGNNFGGSEIAEDSILKQLRLAGRRAAFMGDDTWMSVFPDAFKANMTFPYDSFNVEDLHTVDNGVIARLFSLLSDPSKPFDFLIGHFLGVDHVGHRVGPDHPSMQAKLTQMNDVLTRVVDTLDDDTLLVVMGDHGMDKSGDHGGDGLHETSSALWVYSKARALPQTHTHLPPPPPGLLRYTTFPGTSVPHRAIQQIDILPTLSLLLGLPIPFGNLGTVIPELFWHERTGGDLARALEINAVQIKTYLDTYRSSPSGGELDEAWAGLEAAWAATKVPAAAAASSVEARLITLSNFNWVALDACRAMWAQFSPVLMGMGMGVLGVAILATWAVYTGLSAAQNQWDTWLSEHLARCVRGIAGGSVLGFSAYLLLSSYLPGIDALDFILFTAPILSSLLTLLSSPPPLSPASLLTLPTLLLTLHTLTFLSNSYILWEDRLLPFLLLTSLSPSLLLGLSAPTPRLRARILSFTLLFALCIRLMAIPTVCREEQGPACTVTFFASPSPPAPPLTILLLALPVALGLPYAVMRFLGVTRAEGGVARVFVPGVLGPCLLAGAGYWIVEWAEASGVVLGGGEGVRWARVGRTWVARAVGVWAIGVGGVGWWFVPVCLDVEVKDEDGDGDEDGAGVTNGKAIGNKATRGEGIGKKEKKQVHVIGFANAFGAPYLIFWCVALAVVYAATQLTGQIVLALGTVAMLAWLEVVDSVRDTRALQAAFASATPSAILNPSSSSSSSAMTTAQQQQQQQREVQVRFGDVIPLALLGMHMFFGTGHQATISSIQWKAAFLITPTVEYPWSMVTVVLNSLGGLLVMAVGVPLLGVWNRAPVVGRPSATSEEKEKIGAGKEAEGGREEKGEADPNAQVKIEATLAALAYMGYYVTLLLGTTVSAAVLRRHLMVWKVFAPRFVLGVLGVVVADVGVVLGVGVGVERVVGKVGGMFSGRGRGRGRAG